jgi:asparagine synthase (glutamine-hydrolysing)
MCGVAGILERRQDAPELRAELDAGLAVLERRGPDGEGRWFSTDARVALGHRRLSIIDLSERGAQPMCNADGTLVVTFNGEIYNYRALRRELEAKGARFRSDSDTEVLLHLYEQHGAALVHRLRGMFAFGLWDVPRQRLLLARDPYGIKPLYYSDDGARLRFASQVRALCAMGVPRAIDAAGLAGYYLLGSVPEPLTIVEGVQSLPAGATLVVEQRRSARVERYYAIAHTYAAPPRDEGCATFSDALEDSVGHHLVADVPVGAFLSAGIDSGALLGLMRDAAGPSAPIEAVTLVFDEHAGKPEDEGPLAAEVARAYGAKHTLRRVARAELEADLPAFYAAMDQPTIDGVNSWLVSKAAAERGLKVAISGLGGDELLGGYPSFVDVPRWMRALAPLRRVPALGRTLARRALVPVIERLGQSAKAGFLIEHGASIEGAYLARRGLFMPWELPALMGEARAAQGLARLAILEHVRAQLEPDPGHDFARIATLEASLYMRNQLLRDTDWASMAHSLEVRVPLVDRALLATVAGLRTRPSKRALGLSPDKPLPWSVLDRPKTGFTTPVGRWLQESADTRLQAWRELDALRAPHVHWARRYAYCVAQTYLRDAI